MGASRYHRYHRRDLARRRVGPLHVLLLAAVLTGAGVLAVTLFALVALTQGLVLGVGAIVAARHLRRRYRRAIYR